MIDSRPVLVIGGNGLVGQKIMQLFPVHRQVIGTGLTRSGNNFVRLDICNKENVDAVIDRLQPSCVIHCANFSGGAKRCETEKEAATQFHFEATKYLAEACRRSRSKFVFLSTECVFDGKKEVYDERDNLSPINHYGMCKASSEDWIKTNLKDYLIVRTMFVFGWQPETKTPNALMNTYFAFKKGQSLSTPAYRWGQPTYAGDLAQAIIELTLNNRQGIYHVAGETYINRYDWMKQCCRQLGWNESLILPQDKPNSADIPFPAKIRFDTTRFSNENQTRLQNLNEALKAIQQDMKDHPDVE